MRTNMLNVRKLNNEDDVGYVYDISLDGTVVNALGLNVVSNTDGFNFGKPKKFRYTTEHPYIGKGLGRNVVKGKEYTEVEADVAEFEDTFINTAYNGGVLKNGLGIDEYCDALKENGHVKSSLIDLEVLYGRQGASCNIRTLLAA